MAARENQGLQIALIIFVILTITLIVTTYWFFSNFQQEKEKNKALAADNTRLSGEASKANEDSDKFKGLIGAGATEKIETVQEQAVKDMAKYGKTIPEPNQNYRFLVEYLATELNTANTRIKDISAHEAELTEKIKSDEAAKNAEIAKYTEKLTAVSNDLKQVREEFTKDRDAMIKDKATLTSRFEKTRKDFEELTKQSSGEIATLKEENDKLTTLLKGINEEKLRGVAANEVPDGKITWVNQRNRTVWINLGSADGLRRQTLFSVVGGDESNPLTASRKGKVEVINLKDRHLAEARIIEDDLGDPLMPGDLLFSPTWEAGRAEHFALAGSIDIDNDGESDLQRIRDLIQRNGGVIDEEVDAEGKRSGKMSIQTKYLIVGEEPKAAEGAKLEGWSEIQGEAQTLGIKKINVHEFLNYMGFKPEDRTVSLGKFARPDDFKPRLPNNVQRTVRGNSAPKDVRRPAVKKPD